ncbi:glycosyltransferase [Actinosynnema sp. CA-248983]
MRIAVVALHTTGPPTQVTALAGGLTRLAHKVVVYGTPPDRTPVGYRAVHLTAQADLDTCVRELEQLWSDERPDVVHAHDWTAGVASLLAARRLHPPVVQSFHDIGQRLRRCGVAVHPRREALERLIVRQAAHVLAHGHVDPADLLRMGVPRSRVSTMPDIVDVDRFTPDGPSDARRLPHRLISVGRLRPTSGLDEVIDALSAVPDTELVVVAGRAPGAGAEVGRLAAFAHRHGVRTRVRLATDVPAQALPGLLRSADLLVSTPAGGSGPGVLEAMACGVPVVAAAATSAAALVVDGVTGVVVPPADRPTLVRTLRRLLDSPALRDAYGTAGADRARTCYSPGCVAEKTTRLYRSVTAGQHDEGHGRTPEPRRGVGEPRRGDGEPRRGDGVRVGRPSP